MPFSARSKNNLKTCREELQRIFSRVDELGFECTVIEGHRSQEKQEEYFRAGKSRVHFPQGKHNKVPSDAVDVAPYVKGKLSWDHRHCLYFAGVVMAVAASLGIKLRWGGNWDMDDEVITDQDFQDLVHFELVAPK